MKTKDRTPFEVQRDGFSALVDRLGMADAIRFAQQFEKGQGDYSQERHQWLDSLTVDDIVTRLKAGEEVAAGKSESARSLPQASAMCEKLMGVPTAS